MIVLRLAPLLLLVVAAGVADRSLVRGASRSAQDGTRDDVQRDEGLALFEARVRPALAEHCVTCHSGEKPKGGLRLDSVEGIRSGAAGEPIYVAGRADESFMVEAIRHDDPLIAMPPSEKIPDDAIRSIEAWIDLGAPLPESMTIAEGAALPWFLRPPVDAPAPDSSVGEASVPATPIDAFLQAALSERGVVASAPAEAGAWLRRATFDVTGLPPTALEIQAFVRDVQNLGTRPAREAAVDRLLASPAYAERWARRWLDLMRYAETKAHEFDYPIPNAHEYRDYVIRAFDADVPYDRFVTELFAGDLVSNPRLDPTGTFDESILGTGAWFLGEEVHSPVEPRGDQTDRIAHQVEVLSKSVLALGVACARCHDHKFDPISAEDYHALSGFALSTAPRQVRFESDQHNRSIAREWADLEARSQPIVRAAVASALRAEASALGDWLLVGMEAARTPRPPVRPTAEAVAALDAAVLAALGRAAEPPTDTSGWLPALLIEDFESETLEDAALGPWEREGDAFLPHPIRLADVPSSQSDLVPRGRGCVNSYAGHPEAKDFSADRFLGTLTSAPFPALRRYLHFLIDGGDLEGTRVEILDATSGEVLHKLSGMRKNPLQHRRIDLGEELGREIRIRFVDEESGGWGQIGGDHFVLSNDDDPSELDAARSIAQWEALFASGVDPERVAWVDAVQRESGTRPIALRVLRTLSGGADRGGAEPPVSVDIDYGELSGPSWIVNGPAFGPGPLDPGDVVLDVAAGEVRVAAIASRPAAISHPTWADLQVGASSTNRGSSLNWVQAGRTLVSPTFRASTGRIAHLVRGKGRLFLAVAGHKMVAGPLHRGVIRSFDTGGAWRWVEQNVESAAGLDVRLEITATSDAPVEIARTVVLEDGARPPALDDGAWLAERFLSADLGKVSELPMAERSAALARLLRDAGSLLEVGGVPGRAVSDDERAALYDLAEFVVRELPRARRSVARDLRPLAAGLAELESRRKLSSRLAPAALDLEGQDERILDRGSWRTPRDRAPRRSLGCLRVGDEPLATGGDGSGRLALARDLLASPSGIVQRVWANRTWHALFGRGLVETTDDFGAMGSKPTHPELLDRIALDLARDGWSTKRMIRRLMLTDAYARSTVPAPSSRELDPSNLLLGHMRVRRLEAEEVRDALLFASGELDLERFGPSIPIHLTPFMTGRGRPGASGPLDGDRRRSIYLEVRRNFPHPLLSVFDQPSPSTCHGRRTTANVPAQALTLLNDPFVEGRAEALAASLEKQEPAEALGQLWWRTLGRAPTADERAASERYLAAQPGEAAWVDLAHTLFNVKEFCFLEAPPGP